MTCMNQTCLLFVLQEFLRILEEEKTKKIYAILHSTQSCIARNTLMIHCQSGTGGGYSKLATETMHRRHKSVTN